MVIRSNAAIVLITLLLFSVSVITGYCQVNTEAMRKGGVEDRFRTTLNFDLELNKGNTDFFSYAGNLRFDYKKNRYKVFLVNNIETAEEDDELFTNKAFNHLRGMRKMNDFLTIESFAQIEYNEFLNLNRRVLFGAGGRMRILHREDALTVHLGVAGMYEQEDYTDESTEENKKLLRSTNYLTIKWNWDDHIAFDYTNYFQPDAGNLKDYRILINSSLEFTITEYLSFITTLSYRFDSEPMAGLENYDLGVTNGIQLVF